MRYNQFYVKPMCFGVAYSCIAVLMLIISVTFNTDATTMAFASPRADYKFGDCTILTSPCTHSVEIDWQGPLNKQVFLYYRLDGFYQSHRSFVMNGMFTESQQYRKTDSSYKTQFTDAFTVFKADGTKMVVDTSKVAYPADYDFMINPNTDDTADWNQYSVVEGGGEFNKKYNPSFAFCRVQGRCNCRNESCLVWRKSSPSTSLQKLYGTIETGFPAVGKYTVNIVNMYDSTAWEVTKSVQFHTMGTYGGVASTTFAAQFSLFFGIICVVMAASCCGVAVLGKRDVDEHVKLLRDPERRKIILDAVKKFKS